MTPRPGKQLDPDRHLRLVPPDTGSRMEVGDVLVYGSHGIGRIQQRGPAGEAAAETVTLSFESGLTVTLPVARASEALRPLAGEPELEEVRRMLGAQTEQVAEPWSRRNRADREKVADGGVVALAEIVRDGLQRERRVALATASGRRVGPSDRQLYLQARSLLAAEIALSRGIDVDDADAWIVDQVTDPA